jgi:tetratricopeptide (TPR) repeat protein
MSESRFSRFWNFVKPPPDPDRPKVSPEVLALRRRQRRLVLMGLAVLAVIGGAVGAFIYIENAPQRSEKEFQVGMESMRPGQYPQAIVHFTRALSIPRADAYTQRGNAHRALAELDLALSDYQAAVDLNANLADAHNGIALIYVDRRDWRHALEELNKSLALQPNIDGFYQRGQILEALGEHQKAIDDFDQAISVARDAPYMYRARAMSKEKLGDMDGAHADRILAASLEHR